MSCQSSEFIGRYRQSTASAMAHAESSRARSGIAARATAVHARCPPVLEERLESALRAASEDKTGEQLTRPIEADVLPTYPGHGDARGAHGRL